MQIDFRVAQHLCSRLCHDLVGAAGAVNTGLELVVDEGPETAADALDLAIRSGQQVTRRLSFFRVAFGSGGAGNRTGLADARKLVQDFFEERAIDLDWPEDHGLGDSLRPVDTGNVRLLFNLLLIAIDCLPRGGGLRVAFADLDDGFGIALTMTGQGARLKDEAAAAMDDAMAVDDLTARTVQPYFAARMAASMGSRIEVSSAENDSVQLAALIPAANATAV